MTQFRRIGASLDYGRERFTLDDGYTRAVMRSFVHLYRKGWIYRASRIIHWCPYHQTSLSDLQLVHADVDDRSRRFATRSPTDPGTSRSPPPARRRFPRTSRWPCIPMTSGIAALVGKEAIVPFVERRVPIIADERVEPDFGTGALKVTPGHDPKDFEIGRDHGLEEPMAIGPDGLMNDYVPELRGSRRRRPRSASWTGAASGPALEPRALPSQRRPLRALREPHRGHSSHYSGGARWTI